MLTASAYEVEHRERLSSLIDGELAPAALRTACECWHLEVEARRDWHAWHVAGDVLRSEDLASAGRGDAAFLAAVRERLAREPVVLAPLARAPSRAARWWIPASVAAGFLLVVGTFTLTGPHLTAPAPVLASSAQAPRGSTADPLPQAAGLRDGAQASAQFAGMPTDVVDGRLVRDARLDQYLAAHKQFAGSSALGVPSAFLRSATVDTSAR